MVFPAKWAHLFVTKDPVEPILTNAGFYGARLVKSRITSVMSRIKRYRPYTTDEIDFDNIYIEEPLKCYNHTWYVF